ncbi:MAG: hypothetical protein KTR21_00320 [Rhodobacteraceae bacterium]|nr:hypothetical protein [Paracoccaceae bacterium]
MFQRANRPSLLRIGALGAAIALSSMTVFSVAQAQEQKFDGPRQGKGIANKTIGLIDLGPEIEGMEGRSFRMRHWTVEPGGIVPAHSHAGRPAMIYFLEGEIIQHRSDHDEPEVFSPGDVRQRSVSHQLLYRWVGGGLHARAHL